MKTDKQNMGREKPEPLYNPFYYWGKGLLVSESDIIGDWVDGEITSEMITAAFNPKTL